jgi:threonine synthase
VTDAATGSDDPDVLVDDAADAGFSQGRPGRPFALKRTPVLASRSLGALLGLGSLLFKVESCQPTGSWLDRSAAAIVSAALADGMTGLSVIGFGPLTVALAVQCARAGLRLVALIPEPRRAHGEMGAFSVEPSDSASAAGWLSGLGARLIAVEASLDELRQVAVQVGERVGVRMVDAADPLVPSGLRQVVGELEAAGKSDGLLVVPALVGDEQSSLSALCDHRRTAIPLPLDGPGETVPSVGRPFALVGALESSTREMAASREGSASAPRGGVIAIDVSGREAEAARSLLAREEGLLTSRQGGTALAGLLRALREDRARRPRERWLPRGMPAVIVLTGDPVGAGPPLSADTVPGRPVSLAELMRDPGRLLVEPPGRAGSKQ